MIFFCESKITCFNSPSLIDCSLFKYNLLFDDDELTPSMVHCGVNKDGDVDPFEGCNLYYSSLSCDDILF